MLKFGIEYGVGGGKLGSQRQNGTHPFDGTAPRPTCTVLQVPPQGATNGVP